MREIDQSSLILDNLKKQMEVYDGVNKGIDAQEVSNQDRKSIDLYD